VSDRDERASARAAPADGDRLVVVPTERHAERFARAGRRAETRASLERRLVAELAPDVRLATPEETRVALAEALGTAAMGDRLLEPLARAGGASWMRTVDAIDAAIGALRAARVSSEMLEAVERGGGPAARRAWTLRRAARALDGRLAAASLEDGRASGDVLAAAIAAADPRRVRDAASASRVVARFVVAWDARDRAWWSALDASLQRLGGEAVIELPSFAHPLDAERDRDPLEVLFDDLAQAMGEPPRAATIASPLGDLRLEGAPPRGAPGDDPGGAAADDPGGGAGDARHFEAVASADAPRHGVELRQAADAHAQARAAVDAVFHAIAAGAPVEQIAIGVARIDEEVLGPLRLALAEARLPAHDPRGPAAAAAAIVASALDAHALASRGLPRLGVASLLRSRYLDASRAAAIDDPGEARRALLRLASALERVPSASGPDPVSRLEATAAAYDPDLAKVARRIGELLWSVERAATRAQHLCAARELWTELGYPARAGFDARTTLARDDAPSGLARAELLALSRDAHAWEVLAAALDDYDRAIARLHASATAVKSDVFRHELVRALEAGGPPPGAGRAGAVRIARLTEVAGEPLACLVVLDANEGVLPSAPQGHPLLPDVVVARLREIDPRRAPAPHAVVAARDLATLALAASRASRIVLVHRTRDEAGSLLEPAPLVSWLARGSVPSSSWSGSPLAGSPLTLRDARLRALAAPFAPADAAAIRDAIAAEPARRARIERARESFHGSSRAADAVTGALAADEGVARALTAATGGGDAPLPVTGLESFARCAFQGYASQVLRARDDASPRETPDAREQGTLAHEALAAAFRATRTMWSARPRDAESIRARALEAADGFLQRHASASGLRRLALDQARDAVARVVAWSLADVDFDFALAEQGFGDGADGSWPAYPIEVDGVRARLRGKIDRVDVAAAGAKRVRVVDYKSKSGAKKADKALGKDALQVPLYAAVAAAALGAIDASGRYLPMQELDPTNAPGKDFLEAWRALFATLGDARDEGATKLHLTIASSLRDIRAGALAPRAREEATCDVCSYDGACRRPRFVINEEPEETDAPS